MMSGDILTDGEAAYIVRLEANVEKLGIARLNASRLHQALRDIAAVTVSDDADTIATIQGICRKALK